MKYCEQGLFDLSLLICVLSYLLLLYLNLRHNDSKKIRTDCQMGLRSCSSAALVFSFPLTFTNFLFCGWGSLVVHDWDQI